MTKEELIQKIQASSLEEGAKTAWVARIEQEGVTAELVDDLMDAIQDEMEKNFAALGVGDTESEEYKQNAKAMMDEVEVAQNEFNATMDTIEADVKQTQDALLKSVDDLQAQAIKNSIQE
jgi:crotonobetainyl-CoA:carnitine CoA-transferase CaiB-like acyl-CoA transferase